MVEDSTGRGGGCRAGAVLAAAVGVVAAAAWSVVFLSHERPWALRGDNKLTFLPLVAEVWRQWSAGRLPQWSNGHYGGVPLLADPQAGVFYLPNLAVFGLTAPPHLRAFDLLTAGHLGLLAAGVVRFVRELGGGRGAAIFGAFLVSAGPHFLWWTTFLPALESLAWWPWMLVAAERLTRKHRSGARDALFGSIVLGAATFAGYVEFAFYGACLAGIWVACARSSLGLAARVRRLVGLAVLALRLAAPQWIPTVLEIPDTHRASAPNRMAFLGVPLAAGRAMIDPAAGELPLWRTPFLGAATLFLGVCAVVRRRRRAIVLAGAAVAAALVAAGDRTPLYSTLVTLPGFAFFRGPAKFYLVSQLAVAVLAALGASALFRSPNRWWRRVALMAVTLSVGEHAVQAAIRLPALAQPHLPMEALLPDSLEWLGEVKAVLESPPFATSPPPRTYWATFPSAFGSLPMLVGMEVLGGAQVSMLNRRAQWLLVGPLPAWRLDLFGTQFLVLPGKCVRHAGSGMEPVLERGDLCLARNPAARPRLELLASFVVVSDEAEMLEQLQREPGGPVPVVAEASELDGLSSARSGPSSLAEVVEYLPGFVRLTASSSVPALLLARESWSRGWSAAVDGKAAPVHPAAGLFFAVPVPAGRHDVELRYDTPGLRPGVALFAVWCLLALWIWRRAGRHGAGG